MTHQPYDGHGMTRPEPSWARQAMNGIGGLIALLITGVVILLLVLWKSP